MSMPAQPAAVGGATGFAIQVTNAGPQAAVGVVVTDVLPAGTFLASASPAGTLSTGGLNLALGTLAAGSATNLSVAITIASGTTVTNSAFVSAQTPDPNAANNSASLVITAPPWVISPSAVTGSNTFGVTTLSTLGLHYVLVYKNALTDSAWTSLPGVVLGTGGAISLVDSNPPPRRFYRVLAY